ncbi:MAG: FAD:protein FMN transferase [Acidobacteriota bacterium]
MRAAGTSLGSTTGTLFPRPPAARPRPARPASRSAKAAAAALLASASLLLSACQSPSAVRELHSFQDSTFGTYYVVKVIRQEGDGIDLDTEQTLALIERELAEVDRLMSTYRDDSEIARFNSWLETAPFPASPATLQVIREAIALGELSGGALDVTVNPLVEAWGFGPKDALPEPPAAEVLEELLARVGIEHLEVDDSVGALRKKMPRLTCDLSSLAKGYAVDRVLLTLVESGLTDVLVEIGGEVRTAGVNLEGQPWRLGIERPAGARGEVQRVVELGNEALATSGDYRDYREIDGRRISHLIDPRSGQPVTHQLASVSVLDSSCMRADALATALMVLGEDEGFELAEREGIPALFLVREGTDFVERPSPAFAARFFEDADAALQSSDLASLSP